MRRFILSTTFLLTFIFSPIYAFDLGKAFSDAVDKQINKATNKAKSHVEQKITRSLTRSFPKLAQYARLDDGRPVDLSKGVYVFGYQGCTPSRKTFDFMRRNKIKYVMMDVQKDKKAARIAREQHLPGSPAVFINGEKIIGYQPSTYERLLKKHKKMK